MRYRKHLLKIGARTWVVICSLRWNRWTLLDNLATETKIVFLQALLGCNMLIYWPGSSKIAKIQKQARINRSVSHKSPLKLYITVLSAHTRLSSQMPAKLVGEHLINIKNTHWLARCTLHVVQGGHFTLNCWIGYLGAWSVGAQSSVLLYQSRLLLIKPGWVFSLLTLIVVVGAVVGAAAVGSSSSWY